MNMCVYPFDDMVVSYKVKLIWWHKATCYNRLNVISNLGCQPLTNETGEEELSAVSGHSDGDIVETPS
jgi:hypothetical protein